MERVAGLLFWTEKCLEVRLEGVQRGYRLERKRKVIPCRGARDGQPTGTALSCTVLCLSLQLAVCLQTLKPVRWAGSVIVQELCESRGGRPGLSVLTSLLVSVDVKLY